MKQIDRLDITIAVDDDNGPNHIYLKHSAIMLKDGSAIEIPAFDFSRYWFELFGDAFGVSSKTRADALRALRIETEGNLIFIPIAIFANAFPVAYWFADKYG